MTKGKEKEMIIIKSSGDDLQQEGGIFHKGRALGGLWGTGNILAFDLGGGDIDIHFIVIL